VAQARGGKEADVQLSDYPVTGAIVARQRDLDNFGHLNNVAISAFYEEARVWLGHKTLGQFAFDGEQSLALLIVRLTTDYFGEGFYPGTYHIGVGVSHIGNSSVTWSMAMYDGERLMGGCDAVHANRGSNGGPAPIPDDIKAIFERYRAPSVLRR
jgi:acyl-CoA thioester hydrolase